MMRVMSYLQHRNLMVASFLLIGTASFAGPGFGKKVHALKIQDESAAPNLPAAVETEAAPEPSQTVDGTKEQSTEALLKLAQEQYDNLEYDLVIAPATEVISRPDVSLETKLDAYLLLGSALSIVGDPIDAEKPFRLLLRGRPDYDLPSDTPPKILAVFRKVQVEEKAIAEQLFNLRRNRIIKNLKLTGDHPIESQGGYPLVFIYTLIDPNRDVDAIEVKYRKLGEKNFSALALKVNAAGEWIGAIPGDYTSSENGFVLEYSIETLDANGPLLVIGNAPKFRTVKINPGTTERAAPPPLPLWGILSASGVATLMTSVMAASGATLLYFNYQLNQLAEQANNGGIINGADYQAVRENATLSQIAFWSTMGVSAFGWTIAAVMIPFTNWTGEEDPNAASKILQAGPTAQLLE
jgi:hypothetical protein